MTVVAEDLEMGPWVHATPAEESVDSIEEESRLSPLKDDEYNSVGAAAARLRKLKMHSKNGLKGKGCDAAFLKYT